MPNASLKGSLLIASPMLTEPTFAKTVILMIEHQGEGAAGLVLNRATDLEIRDFSRQAFSEPIDWSKAISLGGPVPGPLVVLHGHEDLGEDRIVDGVLLTSERDRVLECLRLELEPSFIIANYSGWGPGQLESELADDAWLVHPASPELVFGPHYGEAMWADVLRRINAEALSKIAGVKRMADDPSQN